MEIIEIAQICHEANRALQTIQADPTIPISRPWAELDEETKASAAVGVQGIIDGNTPEESHATWCEFKLKHGWVLGEVKDEELKTHPLLVPYAELPASQQLKDHLFTAVVTACVGHSE